MMRSLAIAPIVIAAWAGLAVAQPGTAMETSDRLGAATIAAERGDWATVVGLVTPIADDRDAARGDRAEAHRLLGLAGLDHAQSDRAEEHFLAYLKLDLDGRLDPNLYPPETVAFFENVRGRHAAELRALRPRPRRAIVLNLIPPAGQFQNHERTKAWILAGAGGALLVGNLGSYTLLRRWCDGADDTCEGHTRGARILRQINLGTGIALIGLYAYGVYDGLRHYQRTPAITVAPVAFGGGGGGLGVAGYF